MVRNIHFTLMLEFEPHLEGQGYQIHLVTSPNDEGIRMSPSTPGHFAARRADSEPAALLLLLLFISMLYKYSIGLCVRSFLVL